MSRTFAQIIPLIRTARGPSVRVRRRRIPRQRFPSAVALGYFQAIRRIVERARELVKSRLDPRLERWAAEFRQDAASEEVDSVVAGISRDLVAEFSPARLQALALEYGRRATDFQRGEWLRQVRAAAGVDLLTAEPNLTPRLATFAAENVSLIKNIVPEALADVEQVVLRGVQAGTRAEELAGDIEDRLDVAESRAALIAQDQIGKLVGAVDRERQTANGVSRFEWSTAGDERVRESHAEIDGEVFDWDDLPLVDGERAYPGSPVRCRCVATPIFD